MKFLWLSSCIFFLLVSKIWASSTVEIHLPVYASDTIYQAQPGKKRLVTFFASWCTACQKEVPLLKKLKSTDNGQYEFLAINAGENDQKIKKYLSRYDAGFLVLKDQDISFSKSLGIFELPWNLVLDEDGKILYQGHQPPDELL